MTGFEQRPGICNGEKECDQRAEARWRQYDSEIVFDVLQTMAQRNLERRGSGQ